MIKINKINEKYKNKIDLVMMIWIYKLQIAVVLQETTATKIERKLDFEQFSGVQLAKSGKIIIV